MINSETLQSRYWILAVATPPNDTDAWIEFWPRRWADQRSFSRLLIVLDRNTVFPKRMSVYLPSWCPERQNREVYEFKEDSELPN